MLSIAVETDGELVSVLQRVSEPCLHRTADADVERKAEHSRAVRLRDLRGVVGRGIVDDDDVDRGIECSYLADDPSDRARFVPRRHDRDEGGVPSYRNPGPEPHELQQPARPMRIRVLVEDALPRAPAHLLRLPGIRDQLTVRADGLLHTLDDDELATRLEPALDTLVRIRDDRRT